jgi:hypothetical protein
VTIRGHRRADGICGLHVRCSSCGEELWQSLGGLALATPEVRHLRRAQPRTRALPEREDAGAVVIRFEPPGGRGVDAAFDRTSFRLLGVA